MAPDPRYASKDAVNELKTTIRELHRNGIQVILDVVYNHTAEGGTNGPVFNLKALDPNYYLHHAITTPTTRDVATRSISPTKRL